MPPTIAENILKDLSNSKFFSVASIERYMCRMFVKQCEKGNRMLLLLLGVFLVFVCISAYVRKDQGPRFLDWNAILSVQGARTTPAAPPRDSGTGTANKGEGFCQNVLETVLGIKFIKTRAIPWLMNPETNRRLEIDLYCEEQRLGFEIDGAGHHAFTPGFHGTKENFTRSVSRDRLKDDLCKRNDVLLVRIPYWVTSPGQDPIHGLDPLPKDMSARERLLLHVSAWPSFRSTYPHLYTCLVKALPSIES
jgi:hypothetical protein